MNCVICNDLFLVVDVAENGDRSARPCVCVETGRIIRYLKWAKIPEGFECADLDNYETGHPSCTQSQKLALLMAKRFAQKSVVEAGCKGILFSGSCGTGKTHLGVGILRRLITEQRRRGLFCSSSHLVESIRSSFDRDDISEWEIIEPVLERDVLLLDDLGVGKITEFVQEKLAFVLMERYNRKLTTIITTNYPVKPPRGEDKHLIPLGKTLGDCIGERAYSRLLEMCIPVIIDGSDFRSTVKQARWSVL